MSKILKASIFEVTPKPFEKTLEVPTSKSFANRVLILSALAKEEFIIRNLSTSSDVQTLIKCLYLLGLEIKLENNNATIVNSFPACENGKQDVLELKSGDGGTTNRFLLGLLSLGSRPYLLAPEGHMQERPMKEMFDLLSSLGVSLDKGSHPSWPQVKGPLQTNKAQIEVDCERSTQFATGLALALANTQTKVLPINMKASKAYWEMTENLIERYQMGQREFNVPVDFSSLAYPLACGLTLGKVKITNCKHIDSFQADSVFLEIIEKMGGHPKWLADGLELSRPEKLLPIEIDCSGFPDLVPTLAYVCSCAQGQSKLKNIGVLRHKESDRVEEILKLFKAFNIEYKLEKEQERENLIIQGQSNHQANWIELHPAEDHRMVMVSYLFCRKHSGGKIHNAHHVAKSFSNFFEVME